MAEFYTKVVLSLTAQEFDTLLHLVEMGRHCSRAYAHLQGPASAAASAVVVVPAIQREEREEADLLRQLHGMDTSLRAAMHDSSHVKHEERVMRKPHPASEDCLI